MNFYLYSYENNFEELITHYPKFYRRVYEMVEILKANGRILDTLQANIERTYFNHFIREADQDTIEGWEEAFGIDSNSSNALTLDQRRRVIIGLLCGNGHIGEPEIRKIVSNYTDHPCTVDFAEGVIYLDIQEEIFGEELLYETLLKKIPAHLGLYMNFDTHRVYRQTLNFNFGGVTASEFMIKHIVNEREYRQELPLTTGALDITAIRDYPQKQDRRHKTAISIYSMAYGTKQNTSTLPEVDKDIPVQATGKRGVLTRTRITSKLIKE